MTQKDAFWEEQRIWEQWQASPEYSEYIKLQKAWKLKEAKDLQEKTITAITKEVLKVYIAEFDEKYQLRMNDRVQKLPIWLQWLMLDMHTKIKAKLSWQKDSMTQWKLNNAMLNFVESIYTWNNVAEKNINTLVQIAPELANTEIINYLLELGKKYDDAAKANRNAAKLEKIWEERIKIWEKIKQL
jgi:hypothetical protein